MRKLLTTLDTAVTALCRNVMRSSLTVLGIVIGVAAVIAMVEIGQGASREVQRTIENMGANMLQIYPASSRSSTGVNLGSESGMSLTLGDVDALTDRDRCPAIIRAAPLVRVRGAQVVAGSKNWNPFYLMGTTPEYLAIRDWQNPAQGEPFTDRDNLSMKQVCMLGDTVARELFGKESPVGKKVRIGNKPFEVIGVLDRKGASGFGFDQDDIVLTPWRTLKYKVAGEETDPLAATATASETTPKVNTLSTLYPSEGMKLYPEKSIHQEANYPAPAKFITLDYIMVQARSAADVPDAMDQIMDVLRERHRIGADEADDFYIRDMASFTKAMGTTSNLMSVLLLIVAFISLVVGGVGIMNIMLVSVTERTKEIGLRMAVGAKRRDILRQFLVESALLCLLGGFIGIALGRGVSSLVRVTLNWATEISIPAIVAAVGVSLVVGVVFGYYPAWKASRLDPIEALRYE
jgi:ABC-type antimicrobial peptide transport system permease subunit